MKPEIKELSEQFADMVNIREIEADKTAKMIAHRGFTSKAPENTIPAYIEASKYGYWGAECDIIQTIDKEYILLHDDTVDRMTNGTGIAKDMTLSQLKSFNIDAGANISIYPNLKIPTLEEFIQCCKSYNLVPIIEIKWVDDYNHLIDKIGQLNIQDSCVFICFAKSVTEYIRSNYPNAKIQQLYNKGQVTDAELDYLQKNNFGLDCDYSDVDATLIKKCQDRKIKINCWTLDDQQIANNLIDSGVDYITTNVCINQNSTLYKINGYKKEWIVRNIEALQIAGAGLNYNRIKMDSIQTNTRQVCLDKFYVDKLTIGYKIPSTLKCTFAPFDKNDVRISDLGWFTGTSEVILPVGTVYFILYWTKVDSTEFTISDKFLCKETNLL
jgi:glycerophosphoryl diester phosphodiesterase